MREVIEELEDLRRLMLDEERVRHQALAQVHPVHAEGARNLVHYVALRRTDRSHLETELNAVGLSLDAHPSHILHRVDCLLSLLRRDGVEPMTFDGAGGSSLDERTVDLLGSSPVGRRTRIMVTLGGECSEDYDGVRRLIEAGVDCVRINCARDGREAWEAVAAHVRRAERETGRRCAIFMDTAGAKLRIAAVGAAGERDGSLKVKRGDLLALCPLDDPMTDPTALPLVFLSGREVLEGVNAGASVWFDDGKIGGKVTVKEERRLIVALTHVKKGGATLRPERSVNLPESTLSLSLLTEKDEEDLRFARDHADMVGLSFVRSAETITRAGKIAGTPEGIGIVLKMENVLAVERLPLLMLEAMKRRRAGVLLARGDLAVECGYERLAALQDEAVAFCEAAALPLFWATEVLDTYVRKSRMTRPEMTDVASAARAECVMLNRGDDMLPGIALLDRLLRHYNIRAYKGRSTLTASPLAIHMHKS